jgi:AcrR family transcriptional regulator
MFVMSVVEHVEPLPEPPRPGRVQRRRPPARRRTLNRESIVDAALRVLDAEGLDAVTMRRVAQELDTGGASLYAHVDNKEDLIELLRDRVIAETVIPDPAPERWQEQVKECVREMRRVLVAHRDIARAMLAHIPLGANALTAMDRVLAVLRCSGLPDQVVAYAADVLALYATAVAVEESIYAANVTPEEAERYFGELAAYMRSLPASRFPNTAALAGPLTAGDGDERFEFGLEVLVAGLAAQGTTAARKRWES